MGIQHTNRRGEVYFLQSIPDKKGKLRYSFTRKLKGTPVEALPEGFEVHESPYDAQVFLRKPVPTAILPLELEQVRHAVRRLAGLEHFIVAAEGDDITIHLADVDPGETLSKLNLICRVTPIMARQWQQRMIQQARYTKMMRLTLEDKALRRFSICRWCFRGSIDAWHYLDGGKLANLLERYIPHLGKESFFDLM